MLLIFNFSNLIAFFHYVIVHLKGGIVLLNQVILVGRLVRNPELQITDTGRKRSSITLAVSRSYKNQNGEYDTDFLDCTLWTGIAENTHEYCKSGDVIGVKGRLQTWMLENEDGTKSKRMEIIAEKVTFLSSSRSGQIMEHNDNENGSIEIDVDDDNVQDNVVKESTKKYNKKKKTKE